MPSFLTQNAAALDVIMAQVADDLRELDKIKLENIVKRAAALPEPQRMPFLREALQQLLYNITSRAIKNNIGRANLTALELAQNNTKRGGML